MFYTGNLEKLVDRIFEDTNIYSSYIFESGITTRYAKTENEFKIALPGFSKEDLSIEAESGKLSISATVEKEDEFKKSFSMTFKLPLEVELESITATMEHGILRVEYNKKAETKKVKIS